MIEEWKDVVGYEGIYLVSNLGRVKTIPHNTIAKDGRKMFFPEKIKSQNKQNSGYAMVTLSNNEGMISKTVHRLVAKSFCNGYDKKKDVNHIDGNKENNNSDNLEWVNRSENLRHAFNMGLKNHKKGSSPRAKKVVDTKTGKVYDTIIDAAISIGVNKSTLNQWLIGRYNNKSSLKYLQ